MLQIIYCWTHRHYTPKSKKDWKHNNCS